LVAVVFGTDFLVAAFLVAAFLVAAFFAVVFLVAVFAVTFFAGAFLATALRAGADFATRLAGVDFLLPATRDAALLFWVTAFFTGCLFGVDVLVLGRFAADFWAVADVAGDERFAAIFVPAVCRCGAALRVAPAAFAAAGWPAAVFAADGGAGGAGLEATGAPRSRLVPTRRRSRPPMVDCSRATCRPPVWRDQRPNGR
jgi:hypothetical protein